MYCKNYSEKLNENAIFCGNRASDYLKETTYNVAEGIVSEVDEFFENRRMIDMERIYYNTS